MSNNEATKEEIKAHLPEYLTELGLNPRKSFKCLNPEHDDKNPSMSYNAKKMNVHCFSCGVTYDIFDLVALQNNIQDTKEAFKKTYELFRDKPLDHRFEVKDKPEADYTDYLIQCHLRINETDYPKRRGLSQDTIAHFRLGFEDRFKVKVADTYTEWEVMTIPTSSSSYVVRNIDPNATKSERIRKYGPNSIFNLRAFKETDEPIFVVEGEIDAMSIHECGHHAIALGSVSNIYKLVNHLKSERPRQKLILSLDNDNEGQEAQENLGKALTMNHIEFTTSNIASDHKDINEALLADRVTLEDRIKETLNDDPLTAEREAHKLNSAANYIQDFIQGIRESVNTKPIPTQFKQLDDILDGGLYEGLYIIGAIASLGKTTFLLQIADQIAKSDQDIIIFSLEMSKYELIAKSLSRLTYQYTQNTHMNQSFAKTIRGITNGDFYKNYSDKDKEVITESFKQYRAFANNIYIFEGVGNMGVEEVNRIIEQHINLTGRKPVVIIDYLQILNPYNERYSDKQNIDKSTLELKRMSRTYKIPIIAVSSFNRSSYSNTVSMESFKESGAIEYSSDVLIGLQYEKMTDETNNKGDTLNDLKKQDTRDIMLRILKNRSGQIGDICYGYKTKFSFFYEKSK